MGWFSDMKKQTGGGGGSSSPSNPINVVGTVGSGSNGSGFSSGYTAPKEERETFANDSGGGGGGGGGGSSISDAMKAQQEAAARRAEEARKAEQARQQAEAQKRAQEEAARKAAEEQARRAEEARLAEIARQEELRRQAELARQEAIRRQQESTTATNQAAHEEVSQSATPAPTSAVDDAIAQTDATIETIQEQLNFARNNNSTEDILRLTEDLLEAQRHRQQLDAQARAIAGVGTTSTANPLTVAPQVVNNEYSQPTSVGVSNPLVNNFANTLLRPNDSRSSAFVKNAGRVVRDEDEDEFWTGGNPLREAIDRVNSGNLRATDITVGRPVNSGDTQNTTVYDVNPTLKFSSENPNRPDLTQDQLLGAIGSRFSPLSNFGVPSADQNGVQTPTTTTQNPITRDQFLEAASSIFSPLANFGVRSAEAAEETPTERIPDWRVQDAQNEARKNAELARARLVMQNAGISPEVQAYMDEYGLDPEWLLTPAGTEIRRDLPNNPLRAGEQFNEVLPGTNSFADAVANPSGSGGYSWRDVWNNVQDLAGNAVMSTMFGPTATSLLNLSPTVKNNFIEGLGNLARGVDDYQAQVAEFGKTSDKVLADAITEIAADPNNPTDAELAEASKLAGERLKEMDIKPEFRPVSANSTNNGNGNNPVNNTWTPPSQTDIANYIYNLRSNPFLAEVDRGLGNADFYTRNAVMNYANNEYQNRVAEELQNRMGSENVYGRLSEMDAPGYNPDGSPNTSLETLMNSVNYYDDNGMSLYRNPDGTFSEAVVDSNGNVSYKPYSGDVHVQNRYSPDDILNLFLNYDYGKPGHEGEYLFRGMEWMDNLSEEERAGINALLNAGIFGGSGIRDVNRNGIYNREVSDLTEAEYNKFADIFLNNMPALRDLMEAGLLDRYDENGNLIMGNTDSISDFFFKAYKGGSGSGNGSGNGSGSGSGKGSRSYSRGGYSRGGYSPRSYSSGRSGSYTRSVNTPSLVANTQRYDSGGSNRTPQYATQQRASVSPNTVSQRSNRVYNIMKNWSF